MLQFLEQDNANAAAAVIDNNNNNSVNPTTTTITNTNNTAIKLTEGLDIDKIVQNSAVTVSPIKKNNNNNKLLQSQPLALQQQHRFGRIPRGSSKYSRRVHHSLARMCSHNPTGCDPTHDQWQEIRTVL